MTSTTGSQAAVPGMASVHVDPEAGPLVMLIAAIFCQRLPSAGARIQ